MFWSVSGFVLFSVLSYVSKTKRKKKEKKDWHPVHTGTKLKDCILFSYLACDKLLLFANKNTWKLQILS